MTGSIEIEAYLETLKEKERAPATIEKYRRALMRFAAFIGSGEITKQRVLEFKERLIADNCSDSTVNGVLAAVSGYLNHTDCSNCNVRRIRRQESPFRDPGRELTKAEYDRLRKAAEGQPRLKLLLETIASCGLRVSELRFITVEAAEREEATVRLKGKSRRVLIPRKLARKLLKYAKSRGITEGPVFVARSGRPLDRRQIWAELKRLARAAGVAESKVFPHNLRHLFAVEHYRRYHDIAKLADILGHSSINTTRIYLRTTGEEHRRQLEGMHLVS